ncbi:MAG: ABC transporter permease, partial [Bacteroidota bacterium]
MLLKIAWRNIWRHKTRSTVIIVSVLFGIWSGLFIQAVMNGMVEERIKTAIEKEISHIQLHHPEFKK